MKILVTLARFQASRREIYPTLAGSLHLPLSERHFLPSSIHVSPKRFRQ
jgi:hypothetical protein